MPCRLLTSVFTCVWLAAYTAIPLQGQTPASEDNWPRFRGPDAGVVDDDPALPERWSTTENVTWKVDLPGAAWGSPIVWGDQVFVTTVISDEPRPEPDLDPRAVQNPHTGGLLKQEPLHRGWSGTPQARTILVEDTANGPAVIPLGPAVDASGRADR